MQTKEQVLLKKIRELYAEYTPKEIGHAIGTYRAEVEAKEQDAKIKAQIAELESKLE